MDDDMVTPPFGGSVGSGGSDPGASGSFTQSGSDSGGTGTAGTFSTGGEVTGGTFSTGGFVSGGTFGMSGSPSGGMPAAGGGGTGGGGTGTGGTGGKATGGGGTGGKATGGTGGTPPNGNCAQDPLGAKTGWTATASVHADNCANPTDPYCGPPERGIDGVTNNRYSTGTARTGTEWYQIDFGDTVAVSRVVLNTAAGSTDYTHDYEVRMSGTEAGIDGTAAIVTGAGVQGTTTINFPSPKTGQFLRIYPKTSLAGWWSLAEVDVTCQ